MKFLLRFVTNVAVLMAFVFLSFSQQPVPGLVNVSRLQVEGDRVTEFLELTKQRADVIKKAAPTDVFLLTYRTVVGNGNEFWIFTPMSKFADRDGQSAIAKIIPPEQRAAMAARLSQYVERSRNTIDRSIPDLTVTSSGAKGPATFVRLYLTRAKPGMAEQLINVLKTEIVPALKNMNASMYVSQTELGGSTNDFMGGIGFEKWAELDDATSFSKAMGGEQAVRKWEEKMAQVEAGTEQYVLRYMPEQSYIPAAPAAAPKR